MVLILIIRLELSVCFSNHLGFKLEKTKLSMTPEVKAKIRNALLGRKPSEQTKKKISELRKTLLKNHPELHPNRLCAGIKESYPEKTTREFFENNGLIKNVDFIQQHRINKYFVDFSK